MALKAGSSKSGDEFANSMAEAMEKAFEAEWIAVKGIPLQKIGLPDSRLLFAGIAQGIINHLKEQASDSFVIDVDVTQVSDGKGPLLKSTNQSVINVQEQTGNDVIPAGDADLTQVNTPENMIKSKGININIKIVAHPDSSRNYL